MPYKFESLNLKIPRGHDKRIKLTDGQREEIKKLYRVVSQRKLARHFNVSRSLIKWIGDPESHIQNKRRREERGGWSQYYDPEKHKHNINKTRKRKKKLMQEGKLFKDKDTRRNKENE